MRKFLIPMLLASALAPAAVAAQDGGFRSHRGEVERDASSNDRPQRAERRQRAESSGDDGPAVRVERAERPVQAERDVEAVQRGEAVRVRPVEPDPPARQVERVRRVVNDPSAPSVQRVRRADRDRSVQPVEHVVGVDRGQSDQPVNRVRRVNRDNDGFDDNIRVVRRESAGGQPDGVQVHRDGDRDGFSGLRDRIVRDGDRTGSNHRWNGDWRRDHRYDWRSYRNRYGSRFRLGRYYDPYGWGYRRFSIGFNMWPSYYRSSFWLNDPWQYRLPPAYGPYRWVRYYDDALLVNIHTGQVVDVINNFFW